MTIRICTPIKNCLFFFRFPHAKAAFLIWSWADRMINLNWRPIAPGSQDHVNYGWTNVLVSLVLSGATVVVIDHFSWGTKQISTYESAVGKLRWFCIAAWSFSSQSMHDREPHCSLSTMRFDSFSLKFATWCSSWGYLSPAEQLRLMGFPESYSFPSSLKFKDTLLFGNGPMLGAWTEHYRLWQFSVYLRNKTV